MQVSKLGYQMYGAVSKLARAAGLAKPLRKYLGPVTGRIVFRNATGFSKPSAVRGHQMYLASEDRYPPHNMAMDRYEPGTTRLLEDLIKPGMVVVDVGAHVGYYSLLAAKQVGPEGKVYTFEPEPSNYSLLTKNIELNEYRNIVAMNRAVSAKVGTSTLFLTALDNGRHSTYQHGLPESGSVEVETTTLDVFFEAVGWPRIDVVKVDVEGAEVDVLEGMGQLLQKSNQLTLIIEFNPVLLQNAGVSPSNLIEKLVSSGFNVQYIDEKQGPAPLDAAYQTSLAARLLKDEGSINLFCRPE